MKPLTRLLLGQSRLERVIEERCLHEPILQKPPYAISPQEIAGELDPNNSLKKEYKRTSRMLSSEKTEEIIAYSLFAVPVLGSLLANEVGKNIYGNSQSLNGIAIGCGMSIMMGMGMPIIYLLLNSYAQKRADQRNEKVNEQYYESQ